jgi:hypothetical protein
VDGDALGRSALAPYRFAWPKGRVGTMTYTHTKPVRGEVQTISVRYEMSVELEGSGKRTVTFDKPKVVKAPPGDTSGVENLLGQMQPPITVDGDGRFVGTPPGAAEAVLRSLDKLAGKEVVPAAARASVAAMLDARNQSFWSMLVGRFVGLKVTPGSTYPFQRKVTLLDGFPPMDVSGTGKSGPLRPCQGGPNGAQCVEVSELSTVSASDMEKMLKAFGKSMGVDASVIMGKLGIGTMSIRTVVVTEPQTLLPRLLRWERASEIKLEGKAQKVADIEQWEFSY